MNLLADFHLLRPWWLLALPGYRELLLVLAALSLAALMAFALARPPGSHEGASRKGR